VSTTLLSLLLFPSLCCQHMDKELCIHALVPTNIMFLCENVQERDHIPGVVKLISERFRFDWSSGRLNVSDCCKTDINYI
jgi:hypothetical protein